MGIGRRNQSHHAQSNQGMAFDPRLIACGAGVGYPARRNERTSEVTVVNFDGRLS